MSTIPVQPSRPFIKQQQHKFRSKFQSKYFGRSSAPDQHMHQSADQFMHHPALLAMFIKTHFIEDQQALDKYQIGRVFKWIAIATYAHPVLISYAQQSITKLLNKTNSLFSLLPTDAQIPQLISILESINIFKLIKNFNLKLLKITQQPPKHIFDSLGQLSSSNQPTYEEQYCQGLWKNCLLQLCQFPHFSQFSQITAHIKEDVVVALAEYLQKVNNIRGQVAANIKQVMEDQQLGMTAFQKQVLHPFDIQLSSHESQIVLVPYSPLTGYTSQYIEIWVDRTIQLNSLLGNYVCTEKFGEFQYVKGPLLYAMQKGILLVLNNFEEISNQLLVCFRTLAEQMKIYHNQKTIHATGGFKIMGICSNPQHLSPKIQSIISTKNSYINYISLQKRTISNKIAQFYTSISNNINYQYLSNILNEHQQKYGYLSALKLWQRIIKRRQQLYEKDMENSNKIWEVYFTQSFKDSIQVQIADLTNKIDRERTVDCQVHYREIRIGRVKLDTTRQNASVKSIVKTQYSLSILERLAICVEQGQTPLLISETGCGKTTLVQYLGELGGHQLYVYNMSSGTDVMDLVGGYKPIDCRMLLRQIFLRFIDKFRMLPGSEKNQQYIQALMKMYQNNQLNRLLPSLTASITKIKEKLRSSQQSDHKLQKQQKQWQQLQQKFANIYRNLDKIDSNLVFSFLQGNLIKAMRNGDWVLIDEINLASNDVLQKIVPLIQGKSLLLYEKGDLTYIQRHKDFRIIACMNPANDSGKKPLPLNLMEKFTAISLQEPSQNDIEMMVQQICPQLNVTQISNIYFAVKKQKTISLRNLSRCLAYLNRNKEIYSFKRALYDALLLGFQHKKMLKAYEDQTKPRMIQEGYTEISGFLLQTGDHLHQGEPEIFHLTETFQEHLKDFLRAIAGTQLPVLLEGPTSAGKTSMIRYVASIAGFKCVRINNHQHTQIEQYLGNYFPDKQGKLVFREGPLVQAVRQGYWLILDELNLAKTQILQCLNRLLDDNRQLFIPQQQKHIKPHQNFRIFATQNPSSYSGRKSLSRAFRNRFISLNFSSITIEDTLQILKVRRPLMKDSKQLSNYIKSVLTNLQNYRTKQRVFSKEDGVITMRDLLKWTKRQSNDKQSFMREGYAILAERLRTEAQDEKKYIEDVLKTGIKINKNIVFQEEYERVVEIELSAQILQKSNIYVQMNRSFKRMAALTLKAIKNQQPVLLVGETGCGKTTLAQLISEVSNRKFFSINCHKHTQASDLLGSLRPCINNKQNGNKFEFVNGVVINAMLEGGVLLIDQINTAEDSVLQRLNQLLESNQINLQRGQGFETITAKQGFCIIATMNPSGDYGKKQLSPALRNRFTEIWVEPITHPQFITQAEADIKCMVRHKLLQASDEDVVNNTEQLCSIIFAFLRKYNCELGPKYGLSKKLLTMRDISWICKFINESTVQGYMSKYYWAMRILAVEGINYIMGDISDYGNKLDAMKKQLISFIDQQTGSLFNHPQTSLNSSTILTIIQTLKCLKLPLLLKTDIPLQLLKIEANERIFFSPHTQLMDLLGQFKPEGEDFVWHDEILLKTVKEGSLVALYDLDLAQQPVIEGINSLFDYRGSLFVVELDQVFKKADNFQPIVILKDTNSSDRKKLPNSFLNRFIKLRIPDIDTSTKIAYLQNKYPEISNIPNLITNLTSLADQKIKFEHLEFICQLSLSQNYAQALRMLNIKITQAQMQTKNMIYEQQQIMQLLPIQGCYKENIGKLVDAYIVWTRSKYSVCLVGSMQERTMIVQGLAYLLRKQVRKVILSTATDMADLLGSYEQVNHNDFMDLQRQRKQDIMADIFESVKETNQKVGAMFQYIPSRIVTTLESAQDCLLYVEVPNQALLERLQKGLRAVYEQKVQLVVGIDSLQIDVSQTQKTNTKFIPIIIPQSTSKKLANTKSIFPVNPSCLKHKDPQLRLEQTQNWMHSQLKKQNNRNMARAWQKLYKRLCTINYWKVQSRQAIEDNQQVEIISVWNQQVSKVSDQNIWQYFTTNANVDVLGVGPTTVQEYFNEQLQQCLMMGRSQQQYIFKQTIHELINPYSSSNQLTTKPSSSLPQQQNIQNKFNCLYLSSLVSNSPQNFHIQSQKLLPILYKKSSQPQIHQILTKYRKQLSEMYEKMMNEQYSQILVEFNEEEYKVIPILKNWFSICHYVVSKKYGFMGLITGQPTLHLGGQIEEGVVNYLGYLGIEIGECVDWMAGLQVRDLAVYQRVSHNLVDVIKYRDQAVSCILDSINKSHLLQQITKIQPSNINQQNILNIGHNLFSQFRPKLHNQNQVPQLILPHLRTYLQLQTLQALQNGITNYEKVYSQVILCKYSGYEPQSYYNIKQQLQSYRNKDAQIRSQRYVYRGDDDIRLLQDFYAKLVVWCDRIENSGYDGECLRDVMLEIYRFYYFTYKDILWPLMAGLVLIYHGQMLKSFKHEIPITVQILERLPQKSLKISLQEILVNQEQQNQLQYHDSAKDYTRYQRKFNKTVIVDEYSKEGVERHKENEQEQFRSFFGKDEDDKKSTNNLLEDLFSLLRKSQSFNYGQNLRKKLIRNSPSCQSMAITMHLLYSQTKHSPKAAINIYSESNLTLCSQLTQPLNPLLQEIKDLLKRFNIDSIKVLATLTNKIQEYPISSQVYKTLADCQNLIGKLFQVNAVLPAKHRLNTTDIVNQCIKVRRLQLKNWKQMLQFKLNRTQKSDLLQFVQLYRKLNLIGELSTPDYDENKQLKVLFKLCNDYMNSSRMSCYHLRLHLLALLAEENVINASYCSVESIRKCVRRVVCFYGYLKEPIMQQWQSIKKAKIQQIKQYQKLATWNSQQWLIFKASCQKFQRKVHHIMKKYEEDLSTPISTFHENYKQKYICSSILQFQSIHQKHIEDSVKDNNVDIKYQNIIVQIFDTIADIKQEHHNTQSRMLQLRNGLGELEDFIGQLPEVKGSEFMESCTLAEQMFVDNQLYRRAVKYYYGIWDKLCQKTQTAWNREVVQRFWALTQKIWVYVNSKIPQQNYSINEKFQKTVQDLLILYNKYFDDDDHSSLPELFQSQLAKVKQFLRARQTQYLTNLSLKYQMVENAQEIVAIMKLGYIVSCIALNLEKNGLCVKQENADDENNQGTEEAVGPGLGLGQGEAHEHAQNVGDQIQFQQQALGNKNQQQKQNQENADQSNENDINMQNDFDGEMYDQQRKQNQDDQGEQGEADQQMGSVNQDERSEDIKNEEGKAEGKDNADIEINGPHQGEDQLVDNQKQKQKQMRKNQDKNKEQNQDEEDQQKSDWDDNNQQGEKINKNDAIKQDDDENQQGDEQRQGDMESISGSGQNQEQYKQGEGEMDQENKSNDQNEKDKEDQMEEEENSQGEEGEEKMIDEGQQQNQQNNDEEQQKQKKVRKTRKTNIQAYGRTDLNSQNPLKNTDEMNEENLQKEQGGQQAQGGNDGNKGNGDPVHSLSAELLKQIMDLQRRTGQQNFTKDLNVVANDPNNNDELDSNNNQQQFELTQQNNKLSTNLPAFVQGEQQKQQMHKENEKQRKQAEKQQKEEQKNSKIKQDQQNKSKKRQNKTPSKDNQKDEAKDQNQPNANQQQKKDKRQKLLKQNSRYIGAKQNEQVKDNQENLRKIVSSHGKIKEQIIDIQELQELDEHYTILSQAAQVSKILQEQLKTILEPTNNTEYRGDYKTGKKLNLRKIIPFIASNYRKDRIWLRRTQPSDRNYNIMLALDDTKSMQYGEVGHEALKGLLAISMALQNLGIKICVTGIQDTMRIYKKFEELLNVDQIVKQFAFKHESNVSHDLSIASFVEASIKQFSRCQSLQSTVENKQLCFIISDGKMNKDYVRPYLRDAKKKDIIYVFIIVDSDKHSILSTKSVSMQDGKVKMKLYMSDFPFEYFLIVKDVKELGQVLAMTLMQFIQEQ